MKKSILTSFFIITFFNGLDRTLGFLFKIFLSRELGAENMGVYQIALSVYLVLLTFISGGLPLVVSKQTAKALLHGDEKKASRIVGAALCTGILFGLSLIIFVAAAYYPLQALMGASAVRLLVILTPALLFSAVYSAFRGNLWGREKYVAVSVVEVIEQLARIISCVILFLIGQNKLFSSALSMTIGCGISALAATICFFICRGKIALPKRELKPLFKSQLPITMSKSLGTLVGSLLSVTVPLLFIFSGYPDSKAYELYGSAAGMATPLLYTPMILIGSLAFVLIPTIGASATSNKYDLVNAQARSAIEFSALVACFFIPLFYVLGENIGVIVYADRNSGIFMSLSAWTLLPLSIEAIASSIMNSLDLETRSFINSMIGYAAQALFYVAFARSFTLQTLAAGMGISLTVSAVLHLKDIRKKTGLSPSYLKKITISALLTLPSSLLTRSVYGIVDFLPELLAVIISGLLGMTVFLVLNFLFGGFEIYIFGKGKRKKERKKALQA